MRRKDRMIPEEEARLLLEKGEYGVLATVNGDGRPYAVPLSYLYVDEKIYFHSAKEGHKIDNLAFEPQVSFCVVGETRPQFQQGNFTTQYESVIVDGVAFAVTDPEEKQTALYKLAEKYLPEYISHAAGNIQALQDRTAVYKIEPRSITGKAKR